MFLIKKGKTNIKYLFIVTIIAIFAGGIMFGAFKMMKCSYWWPSSQNVQLPKDETANWKTYKDENLDISFKYPFTWNPEDIYQEEGFFSLDFKTTELKQYHEDQVNLHIVGVNNKYTGEGDLGGWFGYCAVEFNNVEEFCEKGCKKINNNVAIDYRVEQHGDFVFSGLAYTNLSKHYPSLCFEFNLTQVVYELSEEKNIKYYEVADKYDLKSLIENKQVGASILSAINNFERFAGSIKAIEKDETVNWKTYRNEEYGYEIKYPKDFECKDYSYKESEADFLIFRRSCRGFFVKDEEGEKFMSSGVDNIKTKKCFLFLTG